ncbi:hypothetical protein KIN20_009652 [Parelaphostrongylus tenuis]|uniref:Uncharacterized protein n=1 Tax=Parelaphostrongylus tenuis TaxID=148309 RepID=A0AAD5QJT0_PARTN|nr:hypothetical protein KIN20_009652 [Parelaphostrongylus tenuis]
MYVGSKGGNDPKQRLFLYEEVLECQRRRGLHFSPEQIRPLLNSVLANYDAMLQYKSQMQYYLFNMQIQLFAALVRMRTFYGKLYPAFHAAQSVADHLIEMQETGSREDLSDTIEKLRSIVENLKPALPTLE